MRILFLDDMAERQQVFAEEAAAHDVRAAYTVGEALKLLDEVEFEAICLDHDLAEGHYTGRLDDLTGEAVAREIVDRNLRPVVWVHSWNPLGAERMARLLIAADIKTYKTPFKRVTAKWFVAQLGGTE